MGDQQCVQEGASLGLTPLAFTFGQEISHIASVASFFVSRVDVLVDQLLTDHMKAASDPVRQQLRALQGKIAIANARLVYQEFKRRLSGPRFQALKRQPDDKHFLRV